MLDRIGIAGTTGGLAALLRAFAALMIGRLRRGGAADRAGARGAARRGRRVGAPARPAEGRPLPVSSTTTSSAPSSSRSRRSRSPAGASTSAISQVRCSAQAGCLADLGRLEEAEPLLDEVAALLPQVGDSTFSLDGRARRHRVRARRVGARRAALCRERQTHGAPEERARDASRLHRLSRLHTSGPTSRRWSSRPPRRASPRRSGSRASTSSWPSTCGCWTTRAPASRRTAPRARPAAAESFQSPRPEPAQSSCRSRPHWPGEPGLDPGSRPDHRYHFSWGRTRSTRSGRPAASLFAHALSVKERAEPPKHGRRGRTSPGSGFGRVPNRVPDCADLGRPSRSQPPQVAGSNPAGGVRESLQMGGFGSPRSIDDLQ